MGLAREPLYVRKLSRGERNRLKRLAKHGRDGRAAHRARIVLLSGQRKKLSEIAVLMDVTPETAGRWIRRYEAEGVDGLYDRPRPGGPRKADAVYEARLAELAGGVPHEIDSGCPWGVWTVGRLLARMVHEGFKAVSDDTVRRALHRGKFAFLRPKLDLKHKQNAREVRSFRRRLREVKGGWTPIPA
jgi:transposase